MQAALQYMTALGAGWSSLQVLWCGGRPGDYSAKVPALMPLIWVQDCSLAGRTMTIGPAVATVPAAQEA